MTLETWSLLVGILSPLVIALVQQPKWSSAARAAVAFVFCLIAAAVTAGATMDWNFEAFKDKPGALFEAAALVLIAAWSSYQAFWSKIGAAPAIERATSPKA